MVAYSFKKQFALPILSGTKRQTIRANGKRRHARPGDTLQLYTGMRTKYCRLVGTATCLHAGALTIDFADERIIYDFAMGRTIIYRTGLNEFAQRDGFDNWPAMCAFWKAEHPGLPVFIGSMIQWTDFDARRVRT